MKRLAVLLPLALLSCGEKQPPERLTKEGKDLVAPKATASVPEPKEAPTTVAPPASPPHPELLPITRQIHRLLSKRGDTPAADAMKPYTERVPRANGASFDMAPIPGGTFTLGTPADEAGHQDNEGPAVRVAIAPFWMGRCEMTWDVYRTFMENGTPRNLDGSPDRDGDPFTAEAPEARDGESVVDLVAQPPPPTMAMHFEMGRGYSAGWPAISMTQHAASKFCEWLSAQTGHYYRLPTEAEWEYACRAGTGTRWSFGDDPAALETHAWHAGNANFSYHPVGQKEPNAWGLFDMHGNVAEWCLDAYRPDAYAGWTEGDTNPWHPATDRYPRVVRGGHYFDGGPETLRSGARLASSPSWKSTDPRRPKSVWYLTSAPYVGFRVVRPLEIPDIRSMHLMWNTGPGDGE